MTFRDLCAGLAAIFMLAACDAATSPEAPASPAIDRAAELAAQKDAYAQALIAAEASRGAGEPALWTLSDDDTTIHILGTVHLLRPGLEWRSEAIDTALDEADTVIFELDTTSPDAMRELNTFVLENGMFSDGRQLTSVLDPVETEELNKALDYLGLPLDAIQPMKPWFAAVSLSVFQIQKEGYDPQSGVEMVLQADAEAAGKSFDYLETVDDQLGRLVDLPMQHQVDFLMGGVESIEEGSAILDTLVGEWADGDVNGLGLLMANPEMMGSDEVYEAFLRGRNEDWVPKIETLLDDPGTVLVAVGAGHLAGPDSVVTLLRAEGYEVTGP